MRCDCNHFEKTGLRPIKVLKRGCPKLGGSIRGVRRARNHGRRPTPPPLALDAFRVMRAARGAGRAGLAEAAAAITSDLIKVLEGRRWRNNPLGLVRRFFQNGRRAIRGNPVQDEGGVSLVVNRQPARILALLEVC